jgi:hypothetical protein
MTPYICNYIKAKDDLAEGPPKSFLIFLQQGPARIITLFKVELEMYLDLMSDNINSFRNGNKRDNTWTNTVFFTF